jgi:hypothetical protein
MSNTTAIAQAQQRWLQEQGFSSYEEYRQSQLPEGWDRGCRRRQMTARHERNTRIAQRNRVWRARPAKSWTAAFEAAKSARIAAAEADAAARAAWWRTPRTVEFDSPFCDWQTMWGHS